MAKTKHKTSNDNTIALNRRARHDYFLGDRFEAGIVLEGWEVKALRAGKGRIAEAYVWMRYGEAFLLGAHIQPLESTFLAADVDPTRTRKLLLNARELSQVLGAVERRGQTVVPLAMYWKKGLAKLDVALATGKEKHDKRETQKERDWQRRKAQLLRN
ncbi:SsrA-binding protein SmpB [Salinisphaera sp. USBA-960]|uniref:SsrA-binding protein SmpB n=1 Tax=Salinisphaera orenii TaxID=856731 RepID=UPI000DBE5289|nr:SsrA-binding protein SmpB [Salifodinibacter halophilus]NNC25509.1 SsrA-binding protein SmpB [Salifodinibacter halophilus]